MRFSLPFRFGLPLALLLLICTTGCEVLSFEELSVEFHAPAVISGEVAANNEACLIFSIEPDHDSAENALGLSREGQGVTLHKRWDGRRLYLREKPEWKKGEVYRVLLKGAILMADGRTYTPHLDSSFSYGEAQNALRVLTCTPADGAALGVDSEVRIAFNKPLDISAFEASLSINPYCATHTTYDADRCGVTISARDGWGVNKMYTFAIRDMAAADGYTLATPFTRAFQTLFAMEKPQVTAFCPVGTPDLFLLLGADATGAALDGKILNDEGVGIVFSKSMDRDSVHRAVAMEGAKGYLRAVDDKRFVFVTSADWEIGKPCRITVSTAAKSADGLALFEEASAFFIPAVTFLTIDSVTFDGVAPISDFTAPDKITTIAPAFTKNTSGENRLQVTVNFNKAIDSAERSKTLANMDFKPLFPLNAARPVCISAYWAPGGSELRLTWEGITQSGADVQYYYEFNIKGGASGLSTGRGEYLEKNICVVVHIL